MLHQIGSTDKPRQALKRGAFISTYRLLVEALPESRLFLTAALYQPIVQESVNLSVFANITAIDDVISCKNDQSMTS